MACSREIVPESDSHPLVKFSAAPAYNNSLSGTRTAYSGAEYEAGGSRVERIDWVDGDLISINCAQAYDEVKTADYSVVSFEGRQKYSDAQVTSANGLHWNTGRHVFYAMYPSSATAGYPEEDRSAITLEGAAMGGVVRREQGMTMKPGTDNVLLPDMKYAFMFAASTADASDRSRLVELHFKPMFTAFEFTVGSDGENSMTISRFELKSASSALTGAFSAEVTSADGENAAASFTCPSYAEGGNDAVVLDFSSNPVTLSSGSTLTFTVFALPQDLHDVKAVFTTSNGVKTLDMSRNKNGDEVIFPGCRKIKISGLKVPEWTYTIEEIDPTDLIYSGGVSITSGVTSYKTNGGDQVEVNWSVEGYYSDYSCSAPYNGSDATVPPDWIGNITHAHPSGEVDIQYGPEPVKTSGTQDAALMINQTIENNGTKGSATNHLNLSNPQQVDSDLIVESANCYIVNARGYYRIPLVMGNGVKDGGLNPVSSSYLGVNASNARLFKDYTGNDVASPYLHKSSSSAGVPASARIIWEDVEGLIEADAGYSLPDAISVTGSGDDCVYWLNFHVGVAEQGNALIAVMESDGTIMWSYHIWVTHYVPRNYPEYSSSGNQDLRVVPYDTGHSYDSMPFNLGAVIIGDALVNVYEERTVYLKLLQEESGKTVVMTVTQPGFTSLETIPDGGRSPYWQWGRKDPILPNDGYGNTDMTCYGTNPVLNVSTSQATLEASIRNPFVFYATGDRNWLSGSAAYNLWNSDNAEDNTYSLYKTVHKSVYDPCPAGYSMPPAGYFTGFTSNGNDVYSQASARADVSKGFRRGGYFYIDNTRTKTIFFPTQGVRYNMSYGGTEAGHLYGMADVAYAHYWAASHSYLNYAGYCFYFRSDATYFSPTYPYSVSYGYPVRPVQN